MGERVRRIAAQPSERETEEQQDRIFLSIPELFASHEDFFSAREGL
jgi:hypothetical protein